MGLDRRGAELLFQVLTDREEKNSVAIASHQPFSGWTDTGTDLRLCAVITETGTRSYLLTKGQVHSAEIGYPVGAQQLSVPPTCPTLRDS